MGLDIADLGGALSYRRLRIILESSPPTSAFYRSLNGHGWSQTDYLIADLIDVTAKGVFPKPKPYPRPGAAKQDTNKIGGDRVVSLDDAHAIFPFREE